jgi:DNA-binding MarR family transcriptional regulator
MAVETVDGEEAGARRELLDKAIESLDELATQHWKQGPGARWAHHDLSIAQMHLLLVLHERGPATVSQLAEAIGISVPSASSALDREEEAGLVQRRRDRQDRRLVHVTLSARGRELAEQASGFKRQQARQLLGLFERRELEALLTVLAAAQRCFSDQPPANLPGQ